MRRLPVDAGRAMAELPRRLAFFCQQLTGDAAYDRYVAHVRAEHPERALLSREEFHRERQREKWSVIVRCC